MKKMIRQNLMIQGRKKIIMKISINKKKLSPKIEKTII